MELQVINSEGQSSGNVSVSDAVFDRTFNPSLVHQVVVAYMAGARAGTRAQKTRSEVRGGGSKPWRQKGTGRARAGTIRSPLWRSGGVTFAARPQDHSQKVNRKMYRSALRAILSELLRQDRLLVADELRVDEPRTKKGVALLQGLGVTGRRVLLVTAQPDETLVLAVRNLPNVAVCTVSGLAPSELVGAEQVVISKAALEQIEGWLA
jgi:large subunit ribosomal protein L4